MFWAATFDAPGNARLLARTVRRVAQHVEPHQDPVDVRVPDPRATVRCRREASRLKASLEPAEVEVVTVVDQADLDQEVDVVGALVRDIGVVGQQVSVEAADHAERLRVLADRAGQPDEGALGEVAGEPGPH